MSFDAESFLQDYRINYYEGDYHHPHCRPGWIQIECPICSGNPGLHLGFNIQDGYAVCWRCGFKNIDYIIRALTGCSYSEATRIRRKYGGEKIIRRYERAPKENPKINVKFPPGTKKINTRHKRYLESRNFDPNEIIMQWDIKGTGRLGRDKNRIIVPIYFNDALCSYTGRSIIEIDGIERYITCDKDNERRHHKYCLYGYDKVPFNTVLIVEGVTDVWRMGIGTVGTFGIKFTKTQVLLIANKFKKAFVLFDETDPQAIEQGEKLTIELAALGCESEQIFTGLDKDPGNFTNDEANYIIRELLIR